ncbi:MAG: peptide chain release factor N(5)-glutamine methyltransferase [Acidiferrobacteraceae bacterium]
MNASGAFTVGAFLDLAPPSWEPRDLWRRDIEVLVGHVCRLSRAEIIAHPERAIPEGECASLEQMTQRRRAGEPVAYLTEHRGFWTLDLRVTPDTLVPRPETEQLVEFALARIPKNTLVRIADIGTGCGAIALALARERPAAHVVATDVSREALSVAEDNAARHALANIEFQQGNSAGVLTGIFDAIVSNPPYVANGDPCLWGPDLSFEPKIALMGGPDGLDVVRRIAFEARAKLRSGGWLALEHGHDQQPRIVDLLRRYGYTGIEGHEDPGGIPRVVVATWGGS